VITNDEESRTWEEDEVAVAAWAVHAAVRAAVGAAVHPEDVDVARCVGDGDAA
jgi:hypothetical protein